MKLFDIYDEGLEHHISHPKKSLMQTLYDRVHTYDKRLEIWACSVSLCFPESSEVMLESQVSIKIQQKDTGLLIPGPNPVLVSVSVFFFVFDFPKRQLGLPWSPSLLAVPLPVLRCGEIRRCLHRNMVTSLPIIQIHHSLRSLSPYPNTAHSALYSDPATPSPGVRVRSGSLQVSAGFYFESGGQILCSSMCDNMSLLY